MDVVMMNRYEGDRSGDLEMMVCMFVCCDMMSE